MTATERQKLRRDRARGAELERRFRAFSREHRLWKKGDRILAAVSGGADSTALLLLLDAVRRELGLDLSVVHLDHGLRGEESRREARAVKRFARKLGLPCSAGRIDVRAAARRGKLSLETAARRKRLEAFRAAAARRRARLVAVGHQADDQAETVLMRLLRGTGPGGLAGMRPRQPMGEITLVRPLLGFTRAELLDYLRAKGIGYATDSSNRDRRFFRNRVRLDLIPRLERRYSPAVKKLLVRLAELERVRDDYINDRAREALARLSGGGPSLEIEPWLDLPPALRGEVMKLFVAAGGGLSPLAEHLDMIEKLARGGSGKSVRLPGGLKLTREFGLLRSGEQAASGYRYRLPCPGKVRVPEAGVEVTARLRKRVRGEGRTWARSRKAAGKWTWPPERTLSELVDYSRLRPPLEIRSRRSGDGYRPLGRGGGKKLKKLFIDLKIPLSRREIVPVVADSGGIVWPVGAPPADFCRVTETTENLLEISVTRIA